MWFEYEIEYGYDLKVLDFVLNFFGSMFEFGILTMRFSFVFRFNFDSRFVFGFELVRI